jgi:hypothetical protein
MKAMHGYEHHQSLLDFSSSLFSLFAKIQHAITPLKYPDVKHYRIFL